MSEIKVDTLTGKTTATTVTGPDLFKTDELRGKTTANDITVTVGASATMSLEKGLGKAWVNMDGTASSNHIRTSHGLASITDSGTGQYILNFSDAFLDADYVATMNGRTGGGGQSIITINRDASPTTLKHYIYVVNPATPGVLKDEAFVMTVIHGDLA